MGKSLDIPLAPLVLWLTPLLTPTYSEDFAGPTPVHSGSRWAIHPPSLWYHTEGFESVPVSSSLLQHLKNPVYWTTVHPKYGWSQSTSYKAFHLRSREFHWQRGVPLKIVSLLVFKDHSTIQMNQWGRCWHQKEFGTESVLGWELPIKITHEKKRQRIHSYEEHSTFVF